LRILKQSVNIVCVCVGKKYTKEHVNRLYRMVERNCTLPFSFYCISDVQQDVNTIFINEDLDLETYWWKIELFNLDFEDPTLYLDLDVVVQNNLDYLFDKIDETIKTIAFEDIGAYYPYDGTKDNILTIPLGKINSSIMLLYPYLHKELYKKFIENIDYNIVHYYGLDRFVSNEYDSLSFLDFSKDYYHRSKGCLPDNKIDKYNLNYDPEITICILSQCEDEHYKGLEKYFL